MIRKNVAYHEAGHAVASLLIGEGIHAIKIARPSDKGLITDRRGRTVRATGLAELSGSMSPVILRLTLEDRPVMRALMIAVTFNQVFVNLVRFTNDEASTTCIRNLTSSKIAFLSPFEPSKAQSSCRVVAPVV